MKRSKKALFLLITFSLPVLILLLLEMSFRITGSFQQEPLFLKVKEDGIDWYKVNAEVANRYFDANEMAVPKLYPDRFYADKPGNVIRIFCLGGSSTAGFPFEAQVPFPFQLKKMLRAADSKHEYEVINLGLSAVNSFTVLDLMPEILEMEPDMLVIYMGHNEFYGAYGSASTISIGSNGMLVRFFLKIQKWHIVQALKAFVSALSSSPMEPLKDETLMEKVISDKSIAYASDTYQKTLDNFRDNIITIKEWADAASVPVFFGNLVSNVRDMPPMESLTEYEQYTEIPAEPDSADLAEKIKNNETDARLHYQMGLLLIDHDQPLAAAAEFYKAKEYDALRFRASEDLNHIIQSACDAQSTFFVNVKQLIEQKSNYGIPGNDLFCDHLHPNPQGYGLIAESFATEIRKALNLQQNPDTSKSIHVTDLDWEIGLIRVFRLLQRWPFADRSVNYNNYPIYGDSLTKHIAYKYVYENHNWPQSHYNLAGLYLKQNKIASARNQYRAVSDFYPERSGPFHKIAETYMLEGRWQQAETYLRIALSKTKDKGVLYRELSRSQWRQGKIRECMESIQYAIVAPELTPEQKADATFQLGQYLVSGRRYDDARRVLQDAIRFDPQFLPAKELLEELPATGKAK